MSELMRSVARGAVGLGLFAIVTAGVVAVTHALTTERIADNRLASQYQALGQVVPAKLHDNDLIDSAVTLPASELLGQAAPFTVWQARLDGRVSAVILPVDTNEGYSGTISLLVGIATTGKLTGVRVLAHQETPGLGDKVEARKSDWIDQFAGLTLDDPPREDWAVHQDGGRFDAFTGATITPRAVIGAIRRSLEYFETNRATLLGKSDGEKAGP